MERTSGWRMVTTNSILSGLALEPHLKQEVITITDYKFFRTVTSSALFPTVPRGDNAWHMAHCTDTWDREMDMR